MERKFGLGGTGERSTGDSSGSLRGGSGICGYSMIVIPCAL